MRLDHLLSMETMWDQQSCIDSKSTTFACYCSLFRVLSLKVLRAYSSAGLERTPDKREVDGSSPSRPTNLSIKTASSGGVAQLGEHLPCKQGVRSSILLVSTTFCTMKTSQKTKDQPQMRWLATSNQCENIERVNEKYQ